MVAIEKILKLNFLGTKSTFFNKIFSDVVSILADHDVADVVVDAEDIPDIADKHSVETLCQVRRLEIGDQVF